MPPVNPSSMKDGVMLQVPEKPSTRSYYILFGKGNYTITPAVGHTHLRVTMGIATVKDASKGLLPKKMILKIRKPFRLVKRKAFSIDVSVPAKIILSKSGPGGAGPGGGGPEVSINPN